MRKIKIKFLMLFLIIPVLFACDSRLSVDDLTKEVRASMVEEFAKTPANNVKIESLILVRKAENSNEYSGILKTNELNGNFTYNVAVTYDGENMQWQTSE